MATVSTSNDPSNAAAALPPPPPPVQPSSVAPSSSDGSKTPRVDQAVGQVRGALQGTGMFREVTHDDVRNVQSTMNALDQREASQTFGALSDGELKTLGHAMNERGSSLTPDNPAYGILPPTQLGLSASEKQGFLNDAAQRLDGKQLTRLTTNFEKGDVRPLGSAIAANAPATVKADYVGEMARSGQIQPGAETKAGLGSVTRTDGTPQTQAVSDVLSSLNGQPNAFDQAVGSLDKEQLHTLVQSGLGRTTISSGLGGTTEVFQADRLAALQRTAEQTGSPAARARVLNEVNEAISGLKPGQQVVLSNGASLKPSIVPSIPPSPQQVAAKRAEVAAQNQRVDALRKLGTPEAIAKADQLKAQYDAKEKASLAADAYHWVDGTSLPSAPVGYTRASEDPQTLAKYGLKQSDLAPTTSGFRAELYIPDKSIFGPDAKPVLAFKGTTPTHVEDWTTNAGQADGKPTDYFNRAMSVAREVNQRTDGNFELTGHSLGGGMASAAAAVTGAKATTFNASGLHQNTARDFVQKNGGATFDTSRNVTAYQVQGDLITSLQEAAKTIDPARADQVGQVVRFAAGVGSNPFAKSQIEKFTGPIGDIGVLRTAQGKELLGLPEAAGTHVKLDALEADGSPRRQAAAQLTGPDGLISHAQTVLDHFDASVARMDRTSAMSPSEFPESQQVANRIGAGVQAYDEFKADPVLQQAKSGFGESVARHLMDAVQTGLDARTRTLEGQAEQLLTAAH